MLVNLNSKNLVVQKQDQDNLTAAFHEFCAEKPTLPDSVLQSVQFELEESKVVKLRVKTLLDWCLVHEVFFVTKNESLVQPFFVKPVDILSFILQSVRFFKFQSHQLISWNLSASQKRSSEKKDPNSSEKTPIVRIDACLIWMLLRETKRSGASHFKTHQKTRS